MRSQKRVFPAVALLLIIFSSREPARAQVSFAPAQNYSGIAAPYRVLVGDFNGDGKPDLVELSIVVGAVGVLLNNGDGTFASPRAYAALPPDPGGPNAFSTLAVADFNRDTRLDLLVAHGNEIAALMGNGDGTFQTAVINTLNFTAFAFFGVADINGDGNPDAVVYGADPEAVREMIPLLGNGDGTFTRGPSPDGGKGVSTSAALVADFNHDGRVDALFSTGGSNNESDLVVLLGNGDGTFQPALQFASQAPATFSLVSGEFNSEGKLDLVSTSYQLKVCEFKVCHSVGPAGSLVLMLGKGDGTFGGPGVLKGGDFRGPVVGDFDGDGNLDLGAADSTSGTFDFYLGNGSGGFGRSVALTMAGVPVAGDLNGDGLSDLVLLQSGSVEVALNTTPTFSLTASALGSPVHPGGSATFTITVGQQHDFNGTVALSCSAPQSVGIHCSLTPSSLNPGSSSTLTVTTTGALAGLIPSAPQHVNPLYALWLPMPFVVGGFHLRRLSRQKITVLVVGSVLFIGMMFQVACGGGGDSTHGVRGTPAGSYTITTTARSGVTQQSTTVTLKVE